ncbi:hypothetical protein AGDE_12647 [Angomonas deanei]|uniref:Uncharacterized protein n=1 Tax=Angomonas deanei TaxID=59799 RepID=A0A7G2C614_9TRYP|nr:hypothetical protein AGDE_12647 [Angomonas deanei]CAD2215039.1 hypothetical protein, conserved [Angomonas deanei]|eukprot:EPY23911.1 hypothetical protein AGDE_12647 [Angomonas deanei]
MSMAGNALFDSIQRASVAGRRSFSNSISGGLSREASFASVPSDDEGRRPLRRRSTFEQELFNRFGYNSTDLTSQQQREKQEYEQMMSKKKMFPLYRASSVSESTIQKYQLAEKEKAKRRRKAGLLQGVQLDKDDDSVALRLDDGPTGYGVCVSSDEQVERKNKALQEAELELLRFRPMNLNGFYLELLQAVQLALEQQVRASKDMVKNAYHM